MASSGLYVNPNTGQTQAGLQQFRNAIINGDMRINQRGTSTTLTNTTTMTAVGATSIYGVDRWQAYRSGLVTGAVIGQGTALTISDLPFNECGIATFFRIGRLLNNTSTNTIFLTYNMESQDSIKFAGKQVTLSYYYRTGINFSTLSLSSQIFTGTGLDQNIRGGFTGQSSSSLSNPVSSNWIKSTFTVTLSSSINQIAIVFGFTPTGTALAADYFDITGVQLELGSVATPFEVRPYPVELQLCQRYYETIARLDGGNDVGSGGPSYLAWQFKATKRFTPTTGGTLGPGGVYITNISQVTVTRSALAAYIMNGTADAEL